MGKHFDVDFDLNPSGMWGLHVTGDVDGPVDIKWTMQKDFTMGEISMKYKNQNYAILPEKKSISAHFWIACARPTDVVNLLSILDKNHHFPKKNQQLIDLTAKSSKN